MSDTSAPAQRHKITHFRWSRETGAVDAACSCGATATDEDGALEIMRHSDEDAQ